MSRTLSEVVRQTDSLPEHPDAMYHAAVDGKMAEVKKLAPSKLASRAIHTFVRFRLLMTVLRAEARAGCGQSGAFQVNPRQQDRESSSSRFSLVRGPAC